VPSWNRPWYSHVHADGVSALCTIRLSTSVYKGTATTEVSASVLVLERQPEVVRASVVRFDISSGDPSLADLSAVKLDCEAEAVADGVDHLPRAGVVVVREFRVMAVPMKRAVGLLDQYVVSHGGLGAG